MINSNDHNYYDAAAVHAGIENLLRKTKLTKKKYVTISHIEDIGLRWWIYNIGIKFNGNALHRHPVV